MAEKKLNDISDKHGQIPHPIMFLSSWRSLPWYELLSYVIMFASAPMLAYGIIIYDGYNLQLILFTIIALYSGFFAALIWNDITDADIDTIAHPDRPIPSGRITPKKFFIIALFFSASTFIFSYFVSFWCLILVGGTALFVTFHNKYLKRRVRFPAYSEIFTPIQWVIVPIFGYLAVSGSNLYHMFLLVIFTYFADNAHDIAEGIHDLEGDKKHKVRTYAISFDEKTASYISFSMFFISGIIAFILVYLNVFSFVFLILFLAIWTYTLYYSYNLIKSDKSSIKELGLLAGRKGFNYFLIAYDLMFLDILYRLVLHNL
jgi:geranylgeranylglycerol-phosphate geranylgeranyltransferase